MAAVDVLNSAGAKVSEVELPDEIFSIPVKTSVLHEVVRSQLVSKRLGTAASKTRGMVSGSTRKLFRQKGTGNARAGSVKSPLRKGGGVIFGPSPRSYEIKVPKKVRKLALKMALSAKFSDSQLFVVDALELEEIKTKALANVLSTLKLNDLLIVSDADDAKLALSSRNIPDVKVIKTEGLNVYDILKFKNLLLVESSIENIKGRLS
ncbi:MAG TPA: 50S ribosomal protein L4 [Desulfobacter sp.]|jgi:large subunit ribosomal protein L4|uniref:50S ribosomal protein L4 n=1 Tax=unclassified Desulfobacter TaxID=2634406 RepID=UPI000E850976|nr:MULTISPECIES: 50S ribosomal protein L4 [unclassified Desulfobacter]MBP8828080.1 50S ribosomal protein L4 [Desulfobacter sp.]MBP9597587.1 50S ribosomal protein L4 [Desulfobacter sp.]HAR35041.1 50S ribosomal protein L4 [Desulfobacter sp.]HBT87360.1 50S ribosomal protein L4 [Desulfobacter sp.]